MQAPRHDEPGHHQPLTGPDALAKLRELARDFCMFSTALDRRPIPSRPMAIQGVDDRGKLYFFSAASSAKNHEIQADPRVQLAFNHEGPQEYLSVYGHATISRDRALIEQYWDVFVKTWFQGGPDDPDLTVLIVQPETAYYWDTKHNRMVSLLKIAASVVTGQTMDDGVEGPLAV